MMVFETWRTYQEPRLWRFDDHWERWQTSAQLCGLQIPVTKSEVYDRARSIDPDKRCRLSTDGQTWDLSVTDLPDTPAQIVITDAVYGRDNPQAKHDAHDYASFMSDDYFETIWFDPEDTLLEGNITNVFAIIDGQCLTPKTDKILPGLMRSWVGEQITVLETDITREELAGAEAIFLTNMVRGIVPVDAWGDWRSENTQTVDELQIKLARDITCQMKSES